MLAPAPDSQKLPALNPVHREFFHSIKLASCLLSLLCASAAMRAQGSPPMNTDDPGTPGHGRWELNFGAAHVRTASGTETELPIFDFNYGVTEHVEVTYAVAWLSQHANGAPRESGWTNSAVAMKWRFLDAGQGGLSASVHPGIEFNNPGSSSERRGLAERGVVFSLPVEVQYELGFCTVNFEVGPIFHSGQADEWLYGLAIGRPVSESVSLGVELFGDASRRFDRSGLLLNVGLSYTLSPRHSLFVAAGRELHRHDGERATFVGFLGWQVRR